MQEYIRVKEMIAGTDKEDFCVLNYEDEELRRFAEVCPAKTLFFSSLHKLDHGIFLDGGQIILRTGTEEILVAETSGLSCWDAITMKMSWRLLLWLTVQVFPWKPSGR